MSHLTLPRPFHALSFVLLCLAAACSAPQPADPTPDGRSGIPTEVPATGVRTDPTPDIERLLTTIRDADTGQLAVSEADGRFLRTLLLAKRARRVLEIGGASGYSAIWMGLALRETGGSLVTIEYDADRSAALARNIAAAGLDDIVTVVAGDALQEIPKLDGPFDVVFIDAWKPDYLKYFDLTFPKLETGGLILAHNVINKGDEMPEFLERINTSAEVVTSIVRAGDEGISISVKR